MKIIAIAKVDPHTTIEAIRPFLEAEVKYAWKLYREGTVREMYNCQDKSMGVVFILECGSVDKRGEYSMDFLLCAKNLLILKSFHSDHSPILKRSLETIHPFNRDNRSFSLDA